MHSTTTTDLQINTFNWIVGQLNLHQDFNSFILYTQVRSTASLFFLENCTPPCKLARGYWNGQVERNCRVFREKNEQRNKKWFWFCCSLTPVRWIILFFRQVSWARLKRHELFAFFLFTDVCLSSYFYYYYISSATKKKFVIYPAI